MVVSERTRKILVYSAYLFAVSLAFVWGAVNQYWNGRLPTAPDESTGRIYVLHFHGTDGYANGTEIAIFWGLPFAALGLAIVVDMIDRYLDKKNKNAK